MNELKFSKSKQLGITNDMGQTRTRARRELMDLILITWSKCVRTRDGYRCQHCGSKRRPEAHHIIPRSVSNHIGMFDTNNGITLCKEPCHNHWVKVHRASFNEWVDEYLEEQERPSREDMRKLFRESGRRLDIDGLKLLNIALKAFLKSLKS